MERNIRRPHNWEAFSVIVFLLVSIIVGFVVFKINISILLLISSAYTMLIGKRCGYTWKEMEGAVIEKISSTISALFILLGIGFLISTWMFSGTIPYIVYYLIGIINPSFVPLCAFIICSVVSVIIGTSYGTAGTVGVIMIGIAQAMGIPLAITAGAVVSGSYLGQVISPVADMPNLTAPMGDVELYENIKHALYVVVPSLVICCIAYLIIGSSTGMSADLSNVMEVKQGIAEIFAIHPAALLPLVFLFFSSFKKLPVAPSLFVSGTIAIIVGVITNGFTWIAGLNCAYEGFSLSMTNANPDNVSVIITSLVTRGGINSMGSTLVLVFCAFAFAGVSTKIKVLDVIAEQTLGNVHSVAGLTISTVITTVIAAMATANAYLTAIVPIELLKEKYVEAGLHPVNLVRTNQVSGAILIPLIPWAAAGAYMSGVMNMPTVSYLPYAFFCWGTAIVAIILSLFKIGIRPLKK